MEAQWLDYIGFSIGRIAIDSGTVHQIVADEQRIVQRNTVPVEDLRGTIRE